MKAWVKVVGGVFVLGVVAQLVLPKPPAPTAEEVKERARVDSVNTAIRAEEREDRTLIAAAEELVAKRLKDPGSAQFTDLLVVRVAGAPIVCGYVNGKNSFGGYTGAQPFVMGTKGIPILEGDMDASAFTKLWNQSCTAKGAKNGK